MLSLFRHRNFALLWFAGLVSYTGDWILITVLPFYVYDQTGSTLASGMVWIAQALPGLVLGSFAGVFVDRFDRKPLMVVSRTLQVVPSLALILAVRDGPLWVVYPSVFVIATLTQLFAPAENALLPNLIAADRLIDANVLNAMNDNFARILGPVIGGLILSQSGLQGAVIANAATFLGAAILLWLIRASSLALPSGTDVEVQRTSIWRDWIAGLRLVFRGGTIRLLFIVVAISVLADSMLSSLLIPFYTDVVGVGSQMIGLFLACRGIAGVLGDFVVSRLSNVMMPGSLLGWSLVAIGALFLIMIAFPFAPVTIVTTLVTTAKRRLPLIRVEGEIGA
jgi:predicted MFS family arabinose efflux permease